MVKPSNSKLTILPIIIAICFYFITPIVHGRVLASYGNILFDDNFNDGNDNGWEKIHGSGINNTTSLWTVNPDKAYGMMVPWPSTAGNSYAGDVNWGNISWEFDMLPKQGEDRNFQFHVIPSDNIPGHYFFYELHFSGNSVDISKQAPSDPNGELKFPVKNTYSILDGVTYHWKVDLLENHILIYIKPNNQNNYTELFNFYDNNMPIKKGKIGLRVGTGANYPCEVYFDNIVVTDLTPDPTATPTPSPTPTPLPTPTPTPFPYFSQIDPEWTNNKYDFLDETIGSVGCKLSSLAMILKSFGLDKVPWGNKLRDMNPANLNVWLNAEKAKTDWWRSGQVSPQAGSDLSLALHASDSAKYTKLTYKDISPSQTSQIETILNTNHQPLLLKRFSDNSSTKVHFIVADALTQSTPPLNFQILDPYDAATTTYSPVNAKLMGVQYFYPTQSDFSFIYINADQDLKLTLSNPNGLVSGESSQNDLLNNIPQSNIYLEYPLDNHLNPNRSVGKPYWHINVKEPISGTYNLTLQASRTGFYNFELYVYNNLDQVSVFKPRVFIMGKYPVTYTFTYNHDQKLPVATFAKHTSCDYLRQLISFARQWGCFHDKHDLDLLLNHLNFSESSSKGHWSKNNTLDFSQYVGILFHQGKINQTGYHLLTDDINSQTE